MQAQQNSYPGVAHVMPPPLTMITPVLPNSMSSNSSVPSSASTAVLDPILFLQAPNTSAAVWAQARLLILTVDTAWPDAAGVAAAKLAYQNTTNGQVRCMHTKQHGMLELAKTTLSI